jgi:hypothetical protein
MEFSDIIEENAYAAQCAQIAVENAAPFYEFETMITKARLSLCKWNRTRGIDCVNFSPLIDRAIGAASHASKNDLAKYETTLKHIYSEFALISAMSDEPAYHKDATYCDMSLSSAVASHTPERGNMLKDPIIGELYARTRSQIMTNDFDTVVTQINAQRLQRATQLTGENRGDREIAASCCMDSVTIQYRMASSNPSCVLFEGSQLYKNIVANPSKYPGFEVTESAWNQHHIRYMTNIYKEIWLMSGRITHYVRCVKFQYEKFKLVVPLILSKFQLSPPPQITLESILDKMRSLDKMIEDNAIAQNCPVRPLGILHDVSGAIFTMKTDIEKLDTCTRSALSSVDKVTNSVAYICAHVAEQGCKIQSLCTSVDILCNKVQKNTVTIKPDFNKYKEVVVREFCTFLPSKFMFPPGTNISELIAPCITKISAGFEASLSAFGKTSLD